MTEATTRKSDSVMSLSDAIVIALVSFSPCLNGGLNSFLLRLLCLLGISLLLVVDAQVTILADTLCIEGPVRVLAFASSLCPSPGVVAVLAHAVSIVLRAVMSTL
jgi:hypothetical protein